MNTTLLTEQALRTYEQITRRLEAARKSQKKFSARGQRTMAYAALKLRIERLLKIQEKTYARYERRQAK